MKEQICGWEEHEEGGEAIWDPGGTLPRPLPALPRKAFLCAHKGPRPLVSQRAPSGPVPHPASTRAKTQRIRGPCPVTQAQTCNCSRGTVRHCPLQCPHLLVPEGPRWGRRAEGQPKPARYSSPVTATGRSLSGPVSVFPPVTGFWLCLGSPAAPAAWT